MSKTAITNLILDRLIFDSKWFLWLDRFVDTDIKKRKGIGKCVFIPVFVGVVVWLWVLYLLDVGQLAARTES